MLRKSRLIFGVFAVAALSLVACGQADAPATSAPDELPSAAAPADGETRAGEATEFCAEVGRRVSPQDCADFAVLAGDAEQGVAAFNAPDPMARGEVHTLQLAISYAQPEEEAPAATPPPPTTDAVAPAPSTSTESGLARAQRTRLTARIQELRTERAQLDAARVTAQGADLATIDARRIAIDGEMETLNVQMARAPQQTPSGTVDPLSGETVEFTPLVGRFMRAELVGNGFEITPLTPASQEVLPDSVTTWSWRVVANEGGRRSLTLRTVVEGCTADGQCYPLRSTSRNYDVTVTVGIIGQVRDFLTQAPDWLRLVAGVLTALAVLVGAWFGLRAAFRKGRSEG